MEWKFNSCQGLIISGGKFSSIYLLNKAPSFNVKGYSFWKEKLEFFIEGRNCGIWKTVKECPFVPTHNVDDVVVDKPQKDWTKNDKENIQHGLKAKNIITTALGLDEFLWVSHYKTTKETWDILQITHERNNKVKRAMFDTLTHEYELFRMKPKESISQMQTWFTHIASHMRIMGETFSNEELVIKILRGLNCSWQPRVTTIYKSKDLANIDTHTFFGKLKE